MKYFVLIPDGMADEKIDILDNRTPMEAANKPLMDSLAKVSHCGLVQNVPMGMVPESDTANMSILSFDPIVYSKGRSPIEAVSMGLSMDDDDVAIRCNFVTLSDADNYEDRILLDNGAGEISTEEAAVLVEALNAEFANDLRHLYVGMSYRHCMLWKNVDDRYPFARPHDLIGKRIGEHLPSGERGDVFREFMERSCEILDNHPINVERRKKGLNVANSCWLWSPGKKMTLPCFADKFGISGAVISAVDLIKGLGISAKMRSIDVEGATGNLHTNYEGKANAAIDAFMSGVELVYVHLEGPDEHGHRGEAENKMRCIENIDSRVLAPVFKYLQSCGEDFGIMILPDHPTPVRLRTHTRAPVPYLIYSSKNATNGISTYTEDACAEGEYIADGWKLMQYFIDICNR